MIIITKLPTGEEYITLFVFFGGAIVTLISILLNTFSNYTTKITGKKFENEEQFENEFIEKTKEKKIVVCLDDLDRCPGKKIVEVLEIVKTYFEIPKVNVVFIVMCDEKRITEAIEENRSCEGNSGLAQNYINKVFTFQLTIPEFRLIDLTAFALELAQENKYGVLGELKAKSDTGENEFESIINILITPAVDTPRKVKLILNEFSNAYLIAKDRETRKGKEDHAEFMIAGNYVTNNLNILAMTIAIKFLFPQFFKILENNPSALMNHQLKRILANKEKIDAEMLLRESVLFEKIEPGFEVLEEETADVYELLSYEPRIHDYDLAPFIYFATEPCALEIGDRQFTTMKTSSLLRDSNDLKVVFENAQNEKLPEYLKCYLKLIRTDRLEARRNRRRFNLVSILYALELEIDKLLLPRVINQFVTMLADPAFFDEPTKITTLLRLASKQENYLVLPEKALGYFEKQFKPENDSDVNVLKAFAGNPGLYTTERFKEIIRKLIKRLFDTDIKKAKTFYAELEKDGYTAVWIRGEVQRSIWHKVFGEVRESIVLDREGEGPAEEAVGK